MIKIWWIKMQTIQNYFHTFFLRLEPILATCSKHYSSKGGKKNPKILSFGCSIGDEISSILYSFPNAEVYGCDVDGRLLEIASQTFRKSERVTFFESNESNIIRNGPYDIIIASAVLCRNPSPPNYGIVFPFSRFEDIINMLDSTLNADGLLCIPNSGYMFGDCAVRSNYRPVRSDVMHNSTFVDVFHRDGSIFLKQQIAYGSTVYSRHGQWHSNDDEDVFDCVFEKNPDNASQFLTVSPVPDGVETILSYRRKNIDYCPSRSDDDLIIVESIIDVMVDSTGCVKGHSYLLGWSSFINDEMYYRKTRVWHPRGY